MALLGILIFAFLMLHMGDFWWKLKFHDNLPMVTYDGVTMADAYTKVAETFSKWPFVVAYIIGLLALGFHLLHGFQSAFQTLGLRHKKYTPIIEAIGVIYTVLVTVGFAVLPIYMFFN